MDCMVCAAGGRLVVCLCGGYCLLLRAVIGGFYILTGMAFGPGF